MNPWTMAAASFAGGKLASFLTPSQGYKAHQQTERAANQLDTYRTGYDDLWGRGRDTLDTYGPQLDTAISDYSNYLHTDPSQDPNLQYDLAQNNSQLGLDAQRAASRLARTMGTDTASSGALAGGMASIEDQRLAGEAAAQAKITHDAMLQRENRKRAQVQLLAEQIARGQSQLGAGLGGGSQIGGNLLALRSGQESTVNAQDAAGLGGWQALAMEIARGGK